MTENAYNSSQEVSMNNLRTVQIFVGPFCLNQRSYPSPSERRDWGLKSVWSWFSTWSSQAVKTVLQTQVALHSCFWLVLPCIHLRMSSKVLRSFLFQLMLWGLHHPDSIFKLHTLGCLTTSLQEQISPPTGASLPAPDLGGSLLSQHPFSPPPHLQPPFKGCFKELSHPSHLEFYQIS